MIILHIDTSNHENVSVLIKSGRREIIRSDFRVRYGQAEKLLPAIVRLLEAGKIAWSDIRKISVVYTGTSFTALRIGVTAANALAYALGIPVEGSGPVKMKRKKTKNGFCVVRPKYNREPNITSAKKNKKPRLF